MHNYDNFLRLFVKHFENPRLKKRYFQLVYSVKCTADNYDNMAHFVWTLLNYRKRYATYCNEEDAIEIITQALPDSAVTVLRVHETDSVNNLIEMLKTLDPTPGESNRTIVPILEILGEVKTNRSKVSNTNDDKLKLNVRKVSLKRSMNSTQTENNTPYRDNANASNLGFSNFGNNSNIDFNSRNICPYQIFWKCNGNVSNNDWEEGIILALEIIIYVFVIKMIEVILLLVTTIVVMVRVTIMCIMIKRRILIKTLLILLILIKPSRPVSYSCWTKTVDPASAYINNVTQTDQICANAIEGIGTKTRLNLLARVVMV